MIFHFCLNFLNVDVNALLPIGTVFCTQAPRVLMRFDQNMVEN